MRTYVIDCFDRGIHKINADYYAQKDSFFKFYEEADSLTPIFEIAESAVRSIVDVTGKEPAFDEDKGPDGETSTEVVGDADVD